MSWLILLIRSVMKGKLNIDKLLSRRKELRGSLTSEKAQDEKDAKEAEKEEGTKEEKKEKVKAKKDIKRGISLLACSLLGALQYVLHFIEGLIITLISSIGIGLFIILLVIIIVVSSLWSALTDGNWLFDSSIIDDEGNLFSETQKGLTGEGFNPISGGGVSGNEYGFPEIDAASITNNYIRNCWKIMQLANRHRGDLNPVITLYGQWGHENGFRIFSYYGDYKSAGRGEHETENDVYTKTILQTPTGDPRYIMLSPFGQVYAVNESWSRPHYIRFKDDQNAPNSWANQQYVNWGQSRGYPGFVPDAVVGVFGAVAENREHSYFGSAGISALIDSEIAKYPNIANNADVRKAVVNMGAQYIYARGGVASQLDKATWENGVRFQVALLSAMDGKMANIYWGKWDLPNITYDAWGLKSAILNGGITLNGKVLTNSLPDAVQAIVGKNNLPDSVVSAYKSNNAAKDNKYIAMNLGVENLISGNDFLIKMAQELQLTDWGISNNGVLIVGDNGGSLDGSSGDVIKGFYKGDVIPDSPWYRTRVNKAMDAIAEPKGFFGGTPIVPLAKVLGAQGSYIFCHVDGYAGHNGTDITAGAAHGSPIYALMDGVVLYSIRTVGGHVGGYGDFGNYIVIWHGGRVNTTYSHMLSKSPLVAGQIVKKGDQIGYCGSTGFSTGAHVHLELYDGATRLNPATWKQN